MFKDKENIYIYFIFAILLTVLIMYMFWENDASKLKEEINSKNEIISELKSKIEEKDSQIQNLTEQYDNIETSINSLYDELNPSSLDGLEVNLDTE